MTTRTRKTVRIDDVEGLSDALFDIDRDLLVPWASDEVIAKEARDRGLIVAGPSRMPETQPSQRSYTSIVEALAVFHREHHMGSAEYCREEPCRILTEIGWPVSAADDWGRAIAVHDRLHAGDDRTCAGV